MNPFTPTTPISELMQRDVRTVSMDDSLDRVRAVLVSEKLQWVPVVDDQGVAVGVLSVRDLNRLQEQLKVPEKAHAWQLCTYQPIVVAPGTPAQEVARQMVQRHVHHVVVADDNGLAGVVSALDFVQRCT